VASEACPVEERSSWSNPQLHCY